MSWCWINLNSSFSLNSCFGWHPGFAQWWRGAVRAAAERAGSSGASAQGMLWRSVRLPSVTLRRQRFQVLAGCAPMLDHQVQGRLGCPPPEFPEFWRAARKRRRFGGDTSSIPGLAARWAAGADDPDHLRSARVRLGRRLRKRIRVFYTARTGFASPQIQNWFKTCLEILRIRARKKHFVFLKIMF